MGLVVVTMMMALLSSNSNLRLYQMHHLMDLLLWIVFVHIIHCRNLQLQNYLLREILPWIQSLNRRNNHHGHVYHGECLEEMTLEINKFDPSCPVCTFGEKKTTMELKAKQNKRVRNRVLDDCDDFVMFDDRELGKSPKVFESSSAKQPFLARHFSFGSRSNCKSTTQENQSVRKKGFFWTKSSKI